MDSKSCYEQHEWYTPILEYCLLSQFNPKQIRINKTRDMYDINKDMSALKINNNKNASSKS